MFGLGYQWLHHGNGVWVGLLEPVPVHVVLEEGAWQQYTNSSLFVFKIIFLYFILLPNIPRVSLRQSCPYILPHWDRNCRSNLQPQPGRATPKCQFCKTMAWFSQRSHPLGSSTLMAHSLPLDCPSGLIKFNSKWFMSLFALLIDLATLQSSMHSVHLLSGVV